MLNSTLYRGYRTRTFSDIFTSFDIFKSELKACPIPNTLADQDISLIYYLLYSRYGNDAIASSDENRFKFKLFSLIWQHAPLWLKQRSIQEEIRNLNIDEFIQGSKAIYNTAFNPGTRSSTTTATVGLDHINQQNTTNYLKSKPEAYALMLSILERDTTEEFLYRFANLFTPFPPEEAIHYTNFLED